jgi:hypothetical protein
MSFTATRRLTQVLGEIDARHGARTERPFERMTSRHLSRTLVSRGSSIGILKPENVLLEGEHALVAGLVVARGSEALGG